MFLKAKKSPTLGKVGR